MCVSVHYYIIIKVFHFFIPKRWLWILTYSFLSGGEGADTEGW